ncbi:hypothetical protein [Pseudomonas flexibilis]|uniref:Lipoprotein n=1 Tax=Pseudomonas flexibilis TaxID=706570 RepID=A0A0B3BLE0_9PSED|nr:hypothetical protein [Pseudomonas flexibilis]KHO65258.1 hypothetical protein PT85_03960 [Pseudomonas flexibilis]SCX87607.1 hypothetical protein SAMN02927929_00789 [Pseudomonas flexibilis]
MTRWILLGAALALGGCAAKPCEPLVLDSHAQRLLQENDLMQARLLVTSGPQSSLELADALLARIADQDPRGEVALYQAVSLIRQRAALERILPLLERSAERRHPHALALLYKIYNEPFLAPQADRAHALRYREAYAGLDVAKGGYPSFPRALMVVDQLVNPPAHVRGQ